MQISSATAPAPQSQPQAAATNPARDAAATALLKPGLDLLHTTFQNIQELDAQDPAGATPAKLFAGIDTGAFSSSLAAAIEGAALVAPEAGRALQASSQAGAAVAKLVAGAQADTSQLTSERALQFISDIGSQLEVINQASWIVDPARDPRV